MDEQQARTEIIELARIAIEENGAEPGPIRTESARAVADLDAGEDPQTVLDDLAGGWYAGQS